MSVPNLPIRKHFYVYLFMNLFISSSTPYDTFKNISDLMEKSLFSYVKRPFSTTLYHFNALETISKLCHYVFRWNGAINEVAFFAICNKKLWNEYKHCYIAPGQTFWVSNNRRMKYRIHPTMVQHNNAVSTLLSHICIH